MTVWAISSLTRQIIESITQWLNVYLNLLMMGLEKEIG